MAISLLHAFHSAKGDGTDPTKVQPSNWNEEHVLEQDTGFVLGRATAGAGPTEEIPWTAFGRSFINAANASAAQGLIGEYSNIADQAISYRKLQLASAAARVIGSNINPALTITGAANNGSGLVRLTVGSTATFATGQTKQVAGVVGTTEANGQWVITVVDATHIDLQGSAFATTYISGGTIGAGYEEKSISDILDFLGSVVRGDIAARGATTWNRVARGDQGAVHVSDGNDIISGNVPLLHARDQVANGTVGMALTNNTWTTQRLQTLPVNEITGASLASNQIILPAGTYEIDAAAVAALGGYTACPHKIRLRNITDGTTILASRSYYWLTVLSVGGTYNALFENHEAALVGRFTLAAQKTIELQQWVGGGASSGGNAVSSGEVEVYADVLIRKIG